MTVPAYLGVSIENVMQLGGLIGFYVLLFAVNYLA
jgi:hypothetical protein